MRPAFASIRHSLISKLILTVGLTLLLGITGWSYFNIQYQKRKVMENLAAESDRLSTTIKLGTHYAMMINSREDIAEIIKNISKQPHIANVRIYNKKGQIKFSNQPGEIDESTNIKAEACYVCHRSEPPLSQLDLPDRTRIFVSPNGSRLLGILSPIYNESGCATGDCHVHPQGKVILGALDVVLSLKAADREIAQYQSTIIALSLMTLLLTSAAILIFVFTFVNLPIKRLIAGTQLIARGEEFASVSLDREDEIGHLTEAINQMGREIAQKQAELNQQRDEYQNLFELVPCLITVQDREYRLLKYNRVFADKFDPRPDDFCYHAYKGLPRKCPVCPVERTFEDGLSHVSEESGLKKDGTAQHWIVITSPLRNADGEVTAAMEISLDITQRKLLENELEKSENKYHAIFNNIPNPVFVLDLNSFEILDCNDSAIAEYGYDKEEMIGRSFLDLFLDDPRERWAAILRSSPLINQVRHAHKAGRKKFVNIRVSPSEYHGQKVLLVTTSDITKRLEAEHQLSQASKLATLGEMATGVAHELNQPLSVIKTVSSFFIKKVNRKERIDDETLFTLLSKVDSNVDRANKIITHMRLFARKTEVRLVKTQVNEVLERAFEIFSQQLRVRGIEVEWDLAADLPSIMADPDRLEQVFINLLINARDAIEEKWTVNGDKPAEKRISLKTRLKDHQVAIEVRDTGPGVPEELRDKIFDPFFTTKEVGQGTGLGLSISYGIVKDCGGNIYVTSDRGPGACFVIEFPARKDS
ncbi:MAG: ATP-binding protein [Thermodesulfobacteriota bacterium]